MRGSSQRKGPTAVSSAAEPRAMSQIATAGLLHAVAVEVPMHKATFRAMHAADRVPADVGDAVLGARDSRGRDRAERGCRGRRGKCGGAKRGQQSRGNQRCAQGTSPLMRPPRAVASHEAT